MNFKEVKSILKAAIISRKGGVPLEEIEDEFFKHTGTNIPYLSLGYFSLHELMRNMRDEIITERNQNNEVVYVTIPDKKTDHIRNLVSRQKDRVYRQKSFKDTRELTRPYNKKTSTSINRQFFHYGSGGETEQSSSEEENIVIIKDPPRDLTQIHEPIINGLQMIGDDFFLQIAIRNLHQPIWRTKPCSPLHCGLCVSGMTIQACTKELKKVVSLSNKLVILIGAEDIYRGHSSEKMERDFNELLEVLHTCFAFSRSAIKLCTIPPLANLNIYDHVDALIAHRAFNNHIYRLVYSYHYGLVDLYSHMTNVNFETEYKFFQLDARMVSGSKHPYVLFNRRGRRLASNLLTSEKQWSITSGKSHIMEDSSNEHKNSKHDDEPTCSLYLSRAISSQLQSTVDDLSKEILIEAIRASKPSGHWSINQTPRGLIATFILEADAEKLIQHGNLDSIFQGPIQVARFSARDSRYRQSVFLRDVPWAIPLEDLSSALAKQGTSAATIERCRQYVRVELTDASQYEALLRQGLDFFGAARFVALPERVNFWRGGLGINPEVQQSAIMHGGNAIDGYNVQQPDGILQCYRCQGFWHVAANCRHLPRCVRCGEPHSVDFCPRPRNNPICCHCSGPHHAGYKQCPVKLQLQNAIPISITLSTSCIQGQRSNNFPTKSNNSQNEALNQRQP